MFVCSWYFLNFIQFTSFKHLVEFSIIFFEITKSKKLKRFNAGLSNSEQFQIHLVDQTLTSLIRVRYLGSVTEHAGSTNRQKAKLYQQDSLSYPRFFKFFKL
jgi:hypothetical protein